MKPLLIACSVGCFTTGATAQSVSDCDWQASAAALVEPWEDHTTTFANGDVRLAMLDTIEPAVGAFHLLILSPPYDELGIRQCKTVGLSDNTGFSGIMWEALASGYDPEIGLIFEVPVSKYDPETGGFPTSLLSVSLNQATGKIVPVLLADTR